MLGRTRHGAGSHGDTHGGSLGGQGTPTQHGGHISPGTLLSASWILFDGQDFSGEQHVLSEGEYPTLGAMGCLSSATIRSLKKVPVVSVGPLV